MTISMKEISTEVHLLCTVFARLCHKDSLTSLVRSPHDTMTQNFTSHQSQESNSLVATPHEIPWNLHFSKAPWAPHGCHFPWRTAATAPTAPWRWATSAASRGGRPRPEWPAPWQRRCGRCRPGRREGLRRLRKGNQRFPMGYYIYTYIHIGTHMHTHTHMCVCIYIHTYIYIYGPAQQTPLPPHMIMVLYVHCMLEAVSDIVNMSLAYKWSM